MATGSEVFGRYVGEIDVSVEVENSESLLQFGWNYLGFMLVEKAAKDWCRRVVMLSGIGRRIWCFGRHWRIKNPVVAVASRMYD